MLASRNERKAQELRALLPGWRIELLNVDSFPPEDGATYYENARAKARFGRELAAATAWVLGEDSGIEVAGLAGGPGVRSARSAAGDEVGWMLGALTGLDGAAREARYVCELVCLSPRGEELRGTGTLEGSIAPEPAGGEGFGFDPIFVPHGEERTVAELGNDWKALHSHRALAARSLVATVERLAD